MDAPTSPPPLDVAQTHQVSDWSHGSPQLCCRFDTSGQFALAGAMDFSIQRWRLGDGQQATLRGHGSWVRALVAVPGSGQMVSGGYEGQLLWWQPTADDPQPLRTVSAHNGWIRSVAASADGQWVASGGNDGRVVIWSAADGSQQRELTGHGTQVHSVAFDPSGRWLFSGDLKGFVKQWDWQSGQQTRQFDATPLYLYFGGQGVDFGGVRSLAVNGDGSRIAAGGTTDATNPLGAVHKPLAVLFDVASGDRVQMHRAKENFDGVAWSLKFHSDGFLIGGVGGGGGGSLLFWRPEEAGEFQRIALPNLARDMDLHPDGRRILTTHSDSHTRLWSMTAKPAG